MRSAYLILLLAIVLPLSVFAQTQSNDSDTAKSRAQEILKQCREALGGESNLAAIKSLQANGNFRASLSGREVQGGFKIELLLPDKFMRTATMSMGQMEITRIEAVNGDQAWMDMKNSASMAGGPMGGDSLPGGGPGGGPGSSGGGGGPGSGAGAPGGGVSGAGGQGGALGGRGRMEGGIPAGGRIPGVMGPISPEAQAAMQRQLRADFNRFLVAVFLASAGSSQFNYAFERELDAKEGNKVDALSVTGPDGFAVWLFVDQKTHRPSVVNYRAPAPRNPRNQNLNEDETGEPKMIDYQLFFADHKQVGNVWLPHRIVKTSEGRIIEEWKLSKYKLNPDLKPNKFEKKK